MVQTYEKSRAGKTVLTSNSPRPKFDLLLCPPKSFRHRLFRHAASGHVRFLEEAAGLGEVHVGIGSDRTVKELKGRYPVTTQERTSNTCSKL